MKNEHILDQILDKITEFGIQSLSDEDRYILEHKGELPNMMKYKEKLNDGKGLVERIGISFEYENVYLLDITKYDSSFNDVSKFLSDMFIVVEINGILNYDSKKYKCVFYITIDKIDQDKIDQGIEWDTDLFEKYKELEKCENDIDDMIIEIIKTYL